MDSRKKWLSAMLKIVSPVLNALEKGELKCRLPKGLHEDRFSFAPLEAFGRSLLGIAPWLETDSDSLDEQERQLQTLYREKVLKCIDMATNPESSDYMLFHEGGQPLVDAAFLAHALVRAPKALAEPLSEEVRCNLVVALKSSRNITAFNCNWIFFTAMVEAGLYVLGESCDMTRVLYAMRTFQNWYKGDGMYGDGERFHWDYYNSFVIQPMYVDLADLLAGEHPEIANMRETVIARATRYAVVLERMISPEGTYPIIGRSICYHFGAFQMLAQAALQHRLTEELSPEGARCALTAVIDRTMSTEEMFDKEGWLLPGIYGYQPELAEPYINTGSVLAVGNIMNVGYEKVLLMQNDLNMNYSEIVSTYVYKVGLASGITDFSLSTAIGMFNSVINFIMLVIANQTSKKLSGNGIF